MELNKLADLNNGNKIDNNKGIFNCLINQNYVLAGRSSPKEIYVDPVDGQSSRYTVDEEGYKVEDEHETKLVLDEEKFTSHESLFALCDSIISIEFLSSCSSTVTSMDSMLQGCSNLVLLDLSNFDTINVENYRNILNFCNSLEYNDIINNKGKEIFHGVQNYDNLTVLQQK